MATIGNAVEAQKDLQELRVWYNLRLKPDNYSGRVHVLTGRVIVDRVRFCDQAFDGPNNSYFATESLTEIISGELQAFLTDAVHRAVVKEEQRLLGIIRAARAELNALFSTSESENLDVGLHAPLS